MTRASARLHDPNRCKPQRINRGSLSHRPIRPKDPRSPLRNLRIKAANAYVGYRTDNK